MWWSVLFVAIICSPRAWSQKYLGCYEDKFASTERDLVESLFLEDLMTPAICQDKCGSIGMPYFGVQFGAECWCGRTYGKYKKLDDSECNTKCTGDSSQMCGGPLKNSVFEITKKFTQPRKSRDDERPLLALVMIVKDEAHTLPNTLLPIKQYIDYYYILDTGSTDGTQEAIRKTLGEKGEIYEEPFKDYGTSRNRILDLAQQSANPPIFTLMLSADETVYNGGALKRFCEEHRNSKGAMHEAYPIVMDVGWRFDSLRLSRVDKMWRYVGRVHEYLAAPDKKWHPTLRVPDSYIKFRVTDPERRGKREWTILRILQEEKAEKPHDTRTSFYLARTWNVLQNHSMALEEFRRRVALGGWQEEVYESLYAIAWQLKAMDRPWHEVQQAFLEAHQHSPGRAEPLHAIAEHHHQYKSYALVYLFAKRASELTYPHEAVLWVQADVYSWQCHFLVGMSAFHVREYEIGAKSLLIADRHRPRDPQIQDYLRRYQEKLAGDAWDRITAEVDDMFPDTRHKNRGAKNGDIQLQTGSTASSGRVSAAAAAAASSSDSDSSMKSVVVVFGALLGIAGSMLMAFKLRSCRKHKSSAELDKVV